MEYEIGISCRPNYLRPSLSGMHLRIVERDTMDEVVEYLESILNTDEVLQYEGKYWSYIEGAEDNYIRYSVMRFVADDGYQWSIDISEHNDNLKDDYKEPKFTYVDIDD